jgi:hypothetical protein
MSTTDIPALGMSSILALAAILALFGLSRLSARRFWLTCNGAARATLPKAVASHTHSKALRRGDQAALNSVSRPTRAR